MNSFVPPAEPDRLASLASGTAVVLLLVFVFTVGLPLFPPKLADPFWLLAFTGALCTNGFLALLAVLLIHVAVTLDPLSLWHQFGRLVVGRFSLPVAIGFLLLIPLQGLAAWRGLDGAQALSNRAGQAKEGRMAQFRQAVERSTTMAELQIQLAAVQAPPLSAADQRIDFPALKADLLAQIKTQEQAAASNNATTKLPMQALIKDSLRVVLLSLSLAISFLASAQMAPPRRVVAEAEQL